MARKSKGFVELEWSCPNCETRNRGSEKTCANCGAPQTSTADSAVRATCLRPLPARSAAVT